MDKLRAACCGPKEWGRKQITSQAPLFTFEEHFPELAAYSYALKLTVKGTGILEMDEHVLHPFIRVHVLDLDTGRYLAKDQKDRPGVANKESFNCFRFEGENMKEKKCEFIPTDFLLPFSTKMYDLRVNGNNFCEWNEEFVINEQARNIFKGNVVFMFELLEFDPLLLLQRPKSKLLRPDNLYPVAWAYLRPLGTASIHMDRLKL